MQRQQTTPTANLSSPPYDQSPLPSTTDPFMGVAMTQMTAMVSILATLKLLSFACIYVQSYISL